MIYKIITYVIITLGSIFILFGKDIHKATYISVDNTKRIYSFHIIMNLIIGLRFQIELGKKVRQIFLQKFASITCKLSIYIQKICELDLSIITIHK